MPRPLVFNLHFAICIGNMYIVLVVDAFSWIFCRHLVSLITTRIRIQAPGVSVCVRSIKNVYFHYFGHQPPKTALLFAVSPWKKGTQDKNIKAMMCIFPACPTGLFLSCYGLATDIQNTSNIMLHKVRFSYGLPFSSSPWEVAEQFLSSADSYNLKNRTLFAPAGRIPNYFSLLFRVKFLHKCQQ